MKTEVRGPGLDKNATNSRIYLKREAQEIASATQVDVLGAALEAGGDYLIEALITFTVETNGAAFSLDVSADDISVDMWAVDANGLTSRLVANSLAEEIAVGGDLAAEGCLHLNGVVLGAAGGNFKIKSGQHTSAPEAPLAIGAGSYLRVTKLN